jgi:hypothetical protein
VVQETALTLAKAETTLQRAQTYLESRDDAPRTMTASFPGDLGERRDHRLLRSADTEPIARDCSRFVDLMTQLQGELLVSQVRMRRASANLAAAEAALQPALALVAQLSRPPARDSSA